MIYDEGFDIEFNEFSFFAFSKYTINKNKKQTNYNSLCNSTCIGWYHNKDRTKWGCYQAFKTSEDPNKITNYDSKNSLNIVEPTSIQSNILDTMMNMQFKSISNKITNKKEQPEILKNLRLRSSLKNNFIPSSFLAESEKSMLRLESTFKNHALYVSKLHTLKKNWNAGVYPDFSQKTIKDLNKMAGIQRSQISKVIKSNVVEDVSMLPKNFDWMKVLKTSGSQGQCGSCYVYSTIRMIEARIKINYNHDVNLSVQHPLDCSYYNQGCDGGYPYLVMKFASEFGLIPEECKPYKVKSKNFLFIFIFLHKRIQKY